MLIVEAFACGAPLVASDIGASHELIRDQQTGLMFRAGDAASLADSVSWACAHPEDMLLIGAAARAEYCEKYTGERNCSLLVEITERLIRARKERPNNDHKLNEN